MRMEPITSLGPWPATADEATALQDRLRPLVDTTTPGPAPADVTYVAGLDVAYAGAGADDDRLAAAVVVLDARTLAVVETRVVTGRASFPYVPGLFAFRELPALARALELLDHTPELLVCDGRGLAHPRRFGLACHLGLLTGLPTLGVGKTSLVGTPPEPGPARGDFSDITVGGDVLGRVLRTRDRVKPVYVSPGHRLDVATACAHVLHLTPRYRLPETTRAADAACRAGLRAPAG